MDQDNNGQVNEGQKNAPTASDNQTLLAILAYLGPLVAVSYLLGRDIPFVKFHAKQGLVVACIELGAWVLSTMFWQFWMFMGLINLATLILSIIGIVNVAQKKQEELPLVGSFSKYFTF